MRFRWKLLILLISMAILPIIVLRSYGIHNVHRMAEALVAKVEQANTEETYTHLSFLANQYTKAMLRSREQVEMALFLQAVQARMLASTVDHLSVPAMPGPFSLAPHTIASLNPDADCRSNSRPVPCVMAIGYGKRHQNPMNATDVDRIGQSFQAVSQHLGAVAVRHHTLLGDRFYATYPYKPDMLGDDNPWGQTWYHVAIGDRSSLWSAPYPDPVLGQMVMAASLPIENDDNLVGVTSLIISLQAFAEPTDLLSELAEGSCLLIFTIVNDPATGRPGAKVVMRFGHSSLTGNASLGDWLDTEDHASLAALLGDVVRHISGIRQMPLQGRMHFWAYGSFFHQGTGFVILTTKDPKAQSRNAAIKDNIRRRVERIENLTAGFLGVLIVVVIGAGLLFSRSVTSALDVLTRVARQLAQGRFDARVGIHSRDEFGQIGRVFDGLGPKLKDHYHLLQAMHVAVEIQQRLLPGRPPVVPGLDIFAMTIYSDQTGGDYFDYLCTGAGQKLCVAVGDVAGHGLPSALLMANARGMLRLRAGLPGALEAIIGDVNAKFAQDVEEEGQFMTLLLARIDQADHKLEWVRAGHDPGLLYDPDNGVFTDLKGKGTPLGIDPAATFTRNALPLKAGQIICLFSDGIVESRNAAGTLFGREGLKQALRRLAEESARTTVLSVLDAVADFRGNLDQEDDLTLMVVKVQAEG
jgi:sigma-B regulation protein RsbU (phosphoserine phosphatase)